MGVTKLIYLDVERLKERSKVSGINGRLARRKLKVLERTDLNAQIVEQQKN